SSFDAAICRLGLMFMSDLQSALQAVRRSLRPGARFAALVWSAKEKNPSIGIPMDVVRELRGLPLEAAILHVFALSAPSALEQALVQAGFGDVRVEPVSV